MGTRAPSLLVALSDHGLGHLAQTAEVVNALRRRLPDLDLTIRTDLPASALGARIKGGFRRLGGFQDVGMRMASALDVRIEESARAYRALHHNWGEKVAAEAAWLEGLRPDVVLANIPHLALAAAARAGIPALALCSLNWADIYGHYFAGREEGSAILSQLREAYASAAIFLQPEPSMPMPDLPRRASIGPVARRGRRRREAVERLLGIATKEHLVLVAPGGVAFRPPMESWPARPGVRWVVAAAWEVARSDTCTIEELGMPFIDVLASCDALVTKPGYGSFTEAACNSIPVLYVPRGDWPEEPYLNGWLEGRGRCVAIRRQQLDSGAFLDELDQLLAAGPVNPVDVTGADEAAAHIAACLMGARGQRRHRAEGPCG